MKFQAVASNQHRACSLSPLPLCNLCFQQYAAQLLAIRSDTVFPSADLLTYVTHFWVHEQMAMKQAIASRTFTMLDSAP